MTREKESPLLNILSVWALPILLAITLHEAAHAYAARRLGDDTAARLGRVSLNPLRHVDPVGTVLLPGFLLFTAAPFLFGWARPVPVVFGNLHRPRRDMALVALAGPAANLLLATLSALLIHLLWLFPGDAGDWAARNLWNSVLINLLLMIFNLLPIPPLVGGRIAVALLPAPLARPLAALERYGLLIIVGIVFLLPMVGSALDRDLDIAYWLIFTPFDALREVFALLAGR